MKEKSNFRFTFAAAEMFSEKTDYLEALAYLKLYRLQGGGAGDVKEIQRSIGKEMASADFAKMPEKDPAILLQAYTGHDKWMANFERNYLFQWNIHRNAASAPLPVND